MKILSFFLKLFSAATNKENNNLADYHASIPDSKSHDLDTSTERPAMSQKNPWLNPTDNFGKMEKGVEN